MDANRRAVAFGRGGTTQPLVRPAARVRQAGPGGGNAPPDQGFDVPPSGSRPRARSNRSRCCGRSSVMR